MMFISSVALTLAVVTGVYALSSINQTTTGGLQFGKETYPLVLNIGEGATLSGDEINSYTYSSTSAFALPDSSYATKTGYTFAGWYENQDLTGQAVTSIPAKTRGTKTFYAKWDTASIVVTLDPNGGNVSPTSLTVKYNSTYGTLPTPTRTGYTFDGWYTSASGGEKVTSSTTVTNASAHTIYAHWNAYTYTVSYDGNGATDGSTASSTHTYDVEKQLTANGYTRSYVVTFNNNYTGSTNTTQTATATFNGWATSANGAKEYNNQQPVKNLTTTNGATVTLYANWTLGSVTLPTPTRTGYAFAGWYPSATGGSKVGDGGAKYTPTAATTLYAHWTENAGYLHRGWQSKIPNVTSLTSIEFTNTKPTTGTPIQIGATDENSTAYWSEGNASCFGVDAYVNGTQLTIYSPGIIYAPKDSSYLFSSSSSSGQLTNLTSITFNNIFDTSNVTDMSNMFMSCLELTTLDVSSFNTSSVIDMSRMFQGCSALTELNLSSFNTSLVTNMSYMFRNCSKLTTLDLRNFDTSLVTNMSYMFNNCSKLTTLNLSSFNTSLVTNMYCMFAECSKLTTLDLSSFDTSKVTNMRTMFQSCSALTTLDVSGFNTSLVTDMSSMFRNCSKLTTLDLSSFDTSKVTSASNFLSYCGALTTIHTPKIVGSVALPLPSTNSFYTVEDTPVLCPSITSEFANKTIAKGITVTLNANGGSVSPTTKIVFKGQTYGTLPTPIKSGSTFAGWYTSATGGEKVTSSTTVTNASSHTIYAHWTENASYLHRRWQSQIPNVTSLTSIKFTNIKPTTETVYQIGATDENSTAYWAEGNTSCFGVYGYVDGTQLTIYSPGIIYAPKNSGFLFSSSISSSRLTNLTSITFNNVFDTSLVTNMSYMFQSCYALTELDVSSFDTSKVTNVSYMFFSCSGLTELDVGSFKTSKVTDMRRMFASCSALTTLDLSNFDTSKVTDISWMFDSCSQLTTLDLSGFDTFNVTDMSYMFQSCYALTELDLSSFDTSKVTDMRYMFRNCSKLTTLDLSSFDTSKVTNTNASNFLSYCSALTTIHTPKTVGTTALPLPSTNSFYTVEDTPVLCPSITSEFANKTIAKGITVTLNANGGSVSPTTKIVFKGFAYGTLPTPTKSGSTFDGWYTSASGGEKVTSSTTVTNASAHAIYAHWTENASYLHRRWQSQIPNVTSLTSIKFTNIKPTTETVYQIGATDENSTAYWAEGNTSCFGVYGYVDGTQLTIYSPGIIYAPKNSGFLFSSSISSSRLTNLTSITFNNVFDTSLVTNMSYMFQSCYALTELDVSSFDTSKVTNVSYMFFSCSGLTELDVGSFKTSKVTDMRRMFASCSALTTLDLSNFDTSKVTDISWMFDSCSQLTTLDLSGFDTFNVTDMSYMFQSCYALTELDLSSFDTSKVTDMRYMFRNCSKLTTLDLSSFDTSKVTNTNASNFLSYCSALTTIHTPKTVGTTALPLPSTNSFYTVEDTPVLCPSITSEFANKTIAKGITVTLNANGGSVSPTTKIVFKGRTYGTLPTPTKSGSTFDGWYTSASGGEEVTSSTTVTNASAHTIYAHWNAYTYTVSYNGNGATGGSTASSTHTYDVEKQLTANGYTRSYVVTFNNNYTGSTNTTQTATATFNGWATSANGAKEYNNQQPVKNLTTTNGATVTLYANWTLGSVTLPTPTRTGYAFAGWYPSATGGSKVGDGGAKYTPTAATTLYAHWTENASYLHSGWKSKIPSVSSLTSIEFTNTQPTTETPIQIGATDENSTAYWAKGNTSCFGVYAYVNGTELTIYSPGIIYAPKNSSFLFGGSSPSGQLTNLTSITFNNIFDTSLVTNMSYMFLICSALTTLDLSSFDTSKVTSMSYMFDSCSSLERITFGNNFNTSSVTFMSGMFQNCSQLTTLDLSGFNTSSVTDMSYMFYICSQLTTLDVSSFNTSKVTSMSYMFDSCNKLTTLNVSSFDTSKVTNMRTMFQSCSALTTLDLSSFDTSKVTNMYRMFYHCSKLTTLDVSSFDTSKVTSATNFLTSCGALTTIHTPKTVGSVALELPFNDFYTLETPPRLCKSIKSAFQGVTIKRASLITYNITYVTNGATWVSGYTAPQSYNMANSLTLPTSDKLVYSGYVFEGWYTTSSFTGNAVTSIPAGSYGNKTYYACWRENASYLNSGWKSKIPNVASLTSIEFTNTKPTTGTDYQIGVTDENSTTEWTESTKSCYGVYAYLSGTTLKIYSPSAIYAPTDSSYLFSNSTASSRLTNLTSITFNNIFDTSLVTNMSYMFASCSSLKSIKFGDDFDTSVVTSMSGMFISCSALTTLDVSNFNTSSVTDMGDMFSYCSALTTLDLSSFNTSLVTNMSFMFYSCSELTTLDVSSFDTSLVTNMSYMFTACSKLTTLNLSSFNTSNVTNMVSMFSSCNKLTTLNVSSFNTSLVTDMSSMFNNCKLLTELDLSSFNTSLVTDMSGMFSYCSKLTELDVSSFDTSNVTNMSTMFQSCSALTTLDLSSFNTSLVTDMSNIFNFCETITTLDLSNFDTSKVTNMSGMFSYCSGLESITFGDNFDTSFVTNMQNMFFYCSKLATLDLSSFNIKSGTNVSAMLSSCDLLKTIVSPATVAPSVSLDTATGVIWVGSSNKILYSNLPGSNITLDAGAILAPNWKSKVTTTGITSYVFQENSSTLGTDVGATSLTETPTVCYYTVKAYTSGSTMYIRSYFKIFAPQNSGGLFSNLNGRITFTNFDTSQVTNMNGMFAMSSFSSLNLSSFNTAKVTVMSEMFSGSDLLTSISFGSYFYTSKVTNMASMFSGCSKLTRLTFNSNFNTSNVTYMGYMFSGCSALKSISFGTNFKTTNVTNMSYMFSGCSALKSISLSGFNTAKVTNMSYMFNYCSGLTSISLSGFNTAKVTNMSYMFNYCSGLTSISLSSFNTAKVTNMSYMFNGCSGLTTLSLTSFSLASITSNQKGFIDGCSNLDKINTPSTIPSTFGLDISTAPKRYRKGSRRVEIINNSVVNVEIHSY